MLTYRNNYSGFEHHDLGDSSVFYTGKLPEKLNFDSPAFESLWQTHPTDYHKIKIMGRLESTPRWEQAYGMDYYYSGQTHRALPVPPLLYPLLSWAKENIDARLNGILVNWYDGILKHYNGKHQDSVTNIIEGVPFIIISLGEKGIFRLWRLQGTGHIDFPIYDGCVFILPYETNLAWVHEAPHFARYKKRRISVTLRGFIGS